MNKNYITIGIIAIVLIGGVGYFAMNVNRTALPEEKQLITPTTVLQQKEGTMELKGASSEVIGSPSADNKGVKEFIIAGSNFSFSLKEINVKKGDTVKIVFNNKDGFHDWTLDEYNVKTKQLPAGDSETVTFVADKAGTFEYYCSVGQHRKNGMKGNLTVE